MMERNGRNVRNVTWIAGLLGALGVAGMLQSCGGNGEEGDPAAKVEEYGRLPVMWHVDYYKHHMSPGHEHDPAEYRHIVKERSRFVLALDQGKLKMNGRVELHPDAAWSNVRFESPTDYQIEFFQDLATEGNKLCLNKNECVIGTLKLDHHSKDRPPLPEQVHVVFMDIMETCDDFDACMEIILACVDIQCSTELPAAEPGLASGIVEILHRGSGHAHTGN